MKLEEIPAAVRADIDRLCELNVQAVEVECEVDAVREEHTVAAVTALKEATPLVMNTKYNH